MMQENVLKDKTFRFAVRIVKLYRHLCDTKKSTCCQNRFYVVGHRLER